MLIIPAIDLKDGRCVRLRQGDMAAQTVYAEDAGTVAARWQDSGAEPGVTSLWRSASFTRSSRLLASYQPTNVTSRAYAIFIGPRTYTAPS